MRRSRQGLHDPRLGEPAEPDPTPPARAPRPSWAPRQTAPQPSSPRPEKLTEDANTGPVQPKPKIGRADIPGEADLLPDFLADHRAVGHRGGLQIPLLGRPGRRHDRAGGTGRRKRQRRIHRAGADLLGRRSRNRTGSGEFETITEEPPSKPRYVAVEGGRICWTNTADGKNGHGTIGCAEINPTSEEPEESSPNASPAPPTRRGSRSTRPISTGRMRERPHDLGGRKSIARGRSRNYYGSIQSELQAPGSGTHAHPPLLDRDRRRQQLLFNSSTTACKSRQNPQKRNFVCIDNTNQPRGIAVVGEDVYWAGQGAEAIGHAIMARRAERTDDARKGINRAGRGAERRRDRRRTHLLVDGRGDAAEPRQRPLPLRARRRRGRGAERPDARCGRQKRGRSAGHGGDLKRRRARLLHRQRGPRRGEGRRRRGTAWGRRARQAGSAASTCGTKGADRASWRG